MTNVFDGKRFAEEKYAELTVKVARLIKKGITPRLVSIIVGDNSVGLFYANLKKKIAERVGISVYIVEVDSSIEKSDLEQLIVKYNKDKSVHGIMLQLPLSERFSWDETQEILNKITPYKDVDGLGNNSSFSTPTVNSVLKILREAEPFLTGRSRKCVVVGYTGFEGGEIFNALKQMGYDVSGVNTKTEDIPSITRSADILISATGREGLIKADMVKEGSVLIDVGSPKGDIEKDAYEKAVFVSPVPGGVGPVTVSCLLENLVSASE